MIRKFVYTIALAFFTLQFTSAQRVLMQANMENSLEFAWQHKEILDSKIIDNCESLDNWEKGGEAKISLCHKRIKEGNASVKFLTPSLSANSSAPYPTSYLERKFGGANWENFNRIAVWVYAEYKNASFVYLSMDLKNEGKEKVPNNFKKKGY